MTQAGAPTALTAALGASNVAAGNGPVNLAWTAPANNGGAPITGYRIQVRTGTTVVRTVDVTAHGDHRGGRRAHRWSGVQLPGPCDHLVRSGQCCPTRRPTSLRVTLAAAPGTPVATAGNAQVGLTWTAPADTGGSAITGYRVQVRTGATLVRTDILGNVTSATIAGLTNGTAYNFRVRANTAVGLGPCPPSRTW